MKVTSMVTLKRKGKTIVIYINNDDWDNLPDLSFILDIEIYNEPEKINSEKENQV